MNDAIRNVVALYGVLTLQHVRAALETELATACRDGVKMTQAHVGKIELMEACATELDKRGWLQIEPPPYVDICHEDGIRTSTSVRVF